MDISLKHAEDIGAIATALIETLDNEIAKRNITEGNIPIDAAINCLCYAMKIVDPRLSDEELLRRLSRYFAAMQLGAAPRNRGENSSI